MGRRILRIASIAGRKPSLRRRICPRLGMRCASITRRPTRSDPWANHSRSPQSGGHHEQALGMDDDRRPAAGLRLHFEGTDHDPARTQRLAQRHVRPARVRSAVRTPLCPAELRPARLCGRTYQPDYSQPGYGQPYQPGYVQDLLVRLFSRYTYPASRPITQPYNYPNSGYPVLYRPQPGSYNNGYYPNTQPYRPQGTGVIINGRSYTLPREPSRTRIFMTGEREGHEAFPLARRHSRQDSPARSPRRAERQSLAHGVGDSSPRCSGSRRRPECLRRALPRPADSRGRCPTIPES